MTVIYIAGFIAMFTLIFIGFFSFKAYMNFLFYTALILLFSFIVAVVISGKTPQDMYAGTECEYEVRQLKSQMGPVLADALLAKTGSCWDGSKGIMSPVYMLRAYVISRKK